MRLIVLLLAACCLLAGCTTPLGSTTYPHAAMDGIEGTWEFKPELADDAKNAEPPPRFMVEISRYDGATDTAVQTHDPAGRAVQAFAGSSDDRYVVTLRVEGLDERGGATGATELLPIELEGEFIKTRHWTLFTFQRSIRQMDWTGLSAPLQRTVRVQYAGDRIVLYSSQWELSYVPVPMAGEFRFQPAEADGSPTTGFGLVQDVDDIFATLDKVSANEWERLAVFVRAGR